MNFPVLNSRGVRVIPELDAPSHISSGWQGLERSNTVQPGKKKTHAIFRNLNKIRFLRIWLNGNCYRLRPKYDPTKSS